MLVGQSHMSIQTDDQEDLNEVRSSTLVGSLERPHSNLKHAHHNLKHAYSNLKHAHSNLKHACCMT